MTEFGHGPLKAPRRGISIGALLLWIILAGIGGALAWDFYGNEARSRLGILPAATPRAAPPPASSAISANDKMVALLKDLQAAQKNAADQLETLLATSKATADAVAALSAKVDTLQRPTVTVAKKPAPTAPRKPPAVPGPAVANPEQSEPEPPNASTSLRPDR